MRFRVIAVTASLSAAALLGCAPTPDQLVEMRAEACRFLGGQITSDQWCYFPGGRPPGEFWDPPYVNCPPHLRQWAADRYLAPTPEQIGAACETRQI